MAASRFESGYRRFADINLMVRYLPRKQGVALMGVQVRVLVSALYAAVDERLMALVLKTRDPKRVREFESPRLRYASVLAVSIRSPKPEMMVQLHPGVLKYILLVHWEPTVQNLCYSIRRI